MFMVRYEYLFEDEPQEVMQTSIIAWHSACIMQFFPKEGRKKKKKKKTTKTGSSISSMSTITAIITEVTC